MDYTDLVLRLILALLGLTGLYCCFRFFLNQAAEKAFVQKRPLLKRYAELTATVNAQPIPYQKYKEARLLGFPNWYPGVPFFGFTILAALWANTLVVGVAIVLSLFGAVFALILFLVNLFSLKAKCRVCLLTQLSTIGIFLYWLAIVVLSTP